MKDNEEIIEYNGQWASLNASKLYQGIGGRVNLVSYLADYFKGQDSRNGSDDNILYTFIC